MDIFHAYRARLEAEAEAALDQAVKAVRAPEDRGTLAPDPRSDEEIRESNRAMLEEDRRLESQERGSDTK